MFVYRWLKRYKDNRDGATAMEFAILAVPFAALLFSIIELAVVFFINSAMTHAVHDAARTVRTGEFQQSCPTDGDFKDKICDSMAGLGNCQRNMRIDVVATDATFSMTALTEVSLENDFTDDVPDTDPEIAADNYNGTTAQQVVLVRAEYYHPLVIPGKLTRLANVPNLNYRKITSTTAFRNEPFPGATCP